MNKETIEALRQIEKEKNIPFGLLIEALEDALQSAYQKTPHAVPFSEVKIDRETGEIHVFELIFPPGHEPQVEDEEAEIDTSMAEREEITPDDFGRIAAQTAKQVIYQRIREAEQGIVFHEYSNRPWRDRNRYRAAVGQPLHAGRSGPSGGAFAEERAGSHRALRARHAFEGRHQRSLAEPERAADHPVAPQRGTRSPPVRTRGPEIADGLVEIVGVAREPGYRSKISVVSHSEGVDPVGACVGPRGSRVRMVVSELRGEKIDIIPFDEEPARFVAKSLSPARVREVILDDDRCEATVVVPDDQLSLAIGKDGQNARLANRLTGWKIDIKSESEMTDDDTVYTPAQAEPLVVDGRCHALAGRGKRCPNAALPGSLYCGMAQHQALGGDRS